MRFALLLVLASATAAADPLDSLPAGYASVFGSTGAASPLVGTYQRLPDAPPCVAKQLAAVATVFQLNHVPESEALIVYRGKLDRAGVEACLSDVFTAFHLKSSVTQDKQVTVLHMNTATVYLGWEPEQVFQSKDRAQVEAALSHAKRMSDDKALMAVAKRADRTQSMWGASVADYTSRPLGVPSTGMYLEGDIAAKKFAIHLSYATAANAEKAVAAIKPRAKTLAPALRELVGTLTFTRKGTEVSFDPVPIFQHQELIEPAMAELQK